MANGYFVPGVQIEQPDILRAALGAAQIKNAMAQGDQSQRQAEEFERARKVRDLQGAYLTDPGNAEAARAFKQAAPSEFIEMQAKQAKLQADLAAGKRAETKDTLEIDKMRREQAKALSGRFLPLADKVQSDGDWKIFLQMMRSQGFDVDGAGLAQLPREQGMAMFRGYAMDASDYLKQQQPDVFEVKDAGQVRTFYGPKGDMSAWKQIGTSAQFKPETAKGMSIQLPDGTIISADGGSELQKSTRGAIEKETIANQDELSTLGAIEKSFNPEFLTLGNQFGNKLSALTERVGLPISDDSKRQLGEYTDFARNTSSNLNAYINRITGAAVSQGEAARLMKAVPTLDDSPTEFKSKMDGVVKELKLAMARRNYALSRGLNFQDIGLEQLPSLIDRRGDELEAQFSQQGLKPEEVRARVSGQLRKEFGVGF